MKKTGTSWLQPSKQSARLSSLTTSNTFSEESLKPHGITVKHPDEFLIELYHMDSEIVVHELHQQGAELKKPRSIAEVLHSLETCRCTQFVQLIRERLAL